MIRFWRALALGLLTFIVALSIYSCPNIPESINYLESEDSTISYNVPFYTYKVINTYPHDQNAFTQGLAFENGYLYEGTGISGYSTLRKVELETGNILQICQTPYQLFGEGITIYKDKIIQLTWQAKIGFVYDKYSFDLLQQFHYSTDGWGITYDKKQLIMSDGTSILHFWDPEKFNETGKIEVMDNNTPVSGTNELEYVQGEIYANVWQTDFIARISPDTGRITGWIDLEGKVGVLVTGTAALYDCSNIVKSPATLTGTEYVFSKEARVYVRER